MRTCWVIDHPAHARLFAPLMREMSSENDIIIATERPEVHSMLENCDGHLPRRQTIWVPRPVGKGKWRKAYRRFRISISALKGIERVISIGAPLELLAAPKSSQRIYITDTEVNKTAHKIARKSASQIIIPTHFIDELSGKLLKTKARINRINGLHGHIHLRPQLRSKKVRDPPKVLVRRLVGGGIHDSDELLDIPESWLEGLDIESADENNFQGDPWKLDQTIASKDGVITQSVTLASEAVLLGVPTLLISKAERGFLQRLVEEGYPLFIAKEHDEALLVAWLAGLHLTDALELPEWPNCKEELLSLLHTA